MKPSSLVGLSAGGLLAAVAIAIDVGTADPLFWPSLALGLPPSAGLIAGWKAIKRSPEPLSAVRLTAFAVLGAVIITVAVLIIIAAVHMGEPVPE